MTTKNEQLDPGLEYICVDESSGKLAYSYYNEMLTVEEARSFETHLMLCFKCQEIIFDLDTIFDAIRANREERLGKVEPPGKASIIKTGCTELTKE